MKQKIKGDKWRDHIRKWGNSYCVVIPPRIVKYHRVTKGDIADFCISFELGDETYGH